MVNETHVSSNNQHLDTLTSLVEKLAVVTCEICYTLDHSTDICPTFQDNLNAQINTFGGFPILFQMWYDPYSNMYD